jgi:hypothetical protein
VACKKRDLRTTVALVGFISNNIKEEYMAYI